MTFSFDIDSLIDFEIMFINMTRIDSDKKGCIIVNYEKTKSLKISYFFKCKYKSYETVAFDFIFWSDFEKFEVRWQASDFEKFEVRGQASDSEKSEVRGQASDSSFKYNICNIFGEDGNFAFKLKIIIRRDELKCSYELTSIRSNELIKDEWTKDNIMSVDIKSDSFSKTQCRKYLIHDYIEFFNYCKLGKLYDKMLNECKYPDYVYDTKLTYIKVTPKLPPIKYSCDNNIITCEYYEKDGTADVTINIKREIIRKDDFDKLIDIVALIVNRVEDIMSRIDHSKYFY